MADSIKFEKESILANIANNSLQNIDIFFYDEVDSTNTRAKIFAKENPGIRAVFVADRQFAGRGRLGRRFESDGGVGIYMSLVLPECKSPSDATKKTAEAAVKVSDAIYNLTSVTPLIKWVNDLYLSGKKLSGILTEGVFSPEGKLTATVIGIGINVYKRTFSDEISEIATSLEDEGINISSRAQLTAKIIERIYGEEDFSNILKKYRERSTLIGKTVTVFGAGEPYSAEVVGISDDCALIVKCSEGEKELFSGEVSVRQTGK